MKNILLFFYIFSLLTSCQVNKSLKKTSTDSSKDILLKINTNDIGDEFSDNIIHCVNGNVKSVSFSNFSFSKTDSMFIPTYSSFIDFYKNCIYNIDITGHIENRIILKGKNRAESQIEKYEVTKTSKSEHKVEYKQFEYDGKKIGNPLLPTYTNFYKDNKLVKKYLDLEKRTILYSYNDYGNVSLIKIINTDKIHPNKEIKYKYNSNNQVIEVLHDVKSVSNYHQKIIYIYQENSYYKFNINYKNNAISYLDFEYLKFNESNNIVERKKYNPLKYNKKIL